MTLNPPLELLRCTALFLVVVLGLGLPWVASLRNPAAERLCLAAGIGLVTLYLYGLATYWARAPIASHQALPWVAISLVAARWQACAAVLRDRSVRPLLGAFALVVAWSLGFLALVRNYSGAAWALDWAGHYDRAMLFVQQRPTSQLAFTGDTFASRPPLANVVTSVFLPIVGTDFAFYQVISTLCSTLAFLPGWLLAARFSGGSRRATAVFTVLYLLNASVLQNTTYAWTKLPAVFFALAGLYFFLESRVRRSRSRMIAACGFTAAGVLAHYSAAPYAIMLGVAALWLNRGRLLDGRFWYDTAVCSAPAIVLLGTWFAWSMRQHGTAETFLSNTSITSTTAVSPGSFAREKGLNLYYTLVPHPLRGLAHPLPDQESRPGRVRDFFFLLYQSNLPMLFGSVGGILLAGRLYKAWRSRSGESPGFWPLFLIGTAILGIAANGGIDEWGAAHLCLQGLLVLGLAFLASEFPQVSRGWQILLGAGVALDFALGAALHFHLQGIYHSPLAALRDGGAEIVRMYGGGAWLNYEYKLKHGYEFVGDWPLARPLILAALGSVLLLAAVHAATAMRDERT